MEAQHARRPISKGICTFCKTEFAKNKMTQHLKSCKQRQANIASAEEKSQETKTCLFHILAEGRYSPEYWLHFEVPASESLWTLDGFIKRMWIDDLDHLSGFEINGTNYRDDYSDGFAPFIGVKEEVEEEVLPEENEEKEMREIIEIVLEKYAERTALYAEFAPIEDPLPAEWVTEIRKARSVDDFISFLKEELVRVTKEGRQIWKPDQGISPREQHKRSLTLDYQKMVVEDLLEAVEDRSMDALLGRILKVGQKFSYVYDFGSSTYINLRVIAEREGIVQNKKAPVQLMAQNTAPAFPCSVCGKPATKVAMGYFYGGIEDSVYCDTCAEEQDEGEFNALPIINSPRVGVL
jgi:hypothetical protein